MIFSLRVLLVTLIIATSLASICTAEMAILNEKELGDFVAEEGVCDFRLPDACNTDPVLAETLSQNTEHIKKAAATLKADVVHALQIGQINPADVNVGTMNDMSEMLKNKIDDLAYKALLDSMNDFKTLGQSYKPQPSSAGMGLTPH